MGGASGQASELEITVREIMKLKDELYAIIAQHSGKSIEQVAKDADRDYWMTSEESVKYGMIDEVLVRNNK
jgi:ATP-dependent Clp protease protease subunit